MSRLSARAVIDANVRIPEDYSELRINLDFASAGRDIRTLAVISAKRGEGRTTTAVNLAVIYAKSGKKTIIVDADLRNPGVHIPFGHAPDTGLSDLLGLRSSSVETIGQTPIARLSLLPTGSVPSNAPELLASRTFDLLLAELKERYDAVIVDCPPLQYIDAKVVASKCDGALLVLEYGRMTREAAQAVKEELKQVNINLVGTVLNKSKR